MRQYLPILLAFTAVGIGAFVFININSTSTPSITDDQKRTQVSEQIEAVGGETKLLIGDPDAPTTLVEYYDYKCPACNNFHRTTYPEIERKFIDTGKTNLELRITPVIGPDSATAGRGAYCANEQGVFAAYHTAVLDHMWDNFYASGDYSTEFENYLTADTLSAILVDNQIDIDMDAFISCTNSTRFNPFLDENLLLAADDGIQGTPGFAIGEQSFVGGQPISVFEQLISLQLR